MCMSSKVTIKMIAEKANISIGTVDRALRNRPGINQGTKERILKLAQELGYSANPLASALSRKKTIRIAAVYPIAPTYFFGHLGRGVAAAQKELDDFGIEVDYVCSATGNQVDQEEILNATDWSLYDGIVINVCGNEITRYINGFIDNGKAVVTFDADSPSSKRLFFVGHDSRKSGRLGGELMGKMLQGHGKVIVLGSFISAPSFIERYGGFCEVIQSEYPGISVYPCAEYCGDHKAASQIISNVLREMPDVRGIFSTGTSGTIGAAEVVKQNNIKNITVIGYDLTSQIQEALQNGWCSATLYQDPFTQGYQAVRLLARHLLEGWIPTQSRLLVNTRVILKHNIETEEYLDNVIHGSKLSHRTVELTDSNSGYPRNDYIENADIPMSMHPVRKEPLNDS